jgi:hypothetical protein
MVKFIDGKNIFNKRTISGVQRNGIRASYEKKKN